MKHRLSREWIGCRQSPDPDGQIMGPWGQGSGPGGRSVWRVNQTCGNVVDDTEDWMKATETGYHKVLCTVSGTAVLYKCGTRFPLVYLLAPDLITPLEVPSKIRKEIYIPEDFIPHSDCRAV